MGDFILKLEKGNVKNNKGRPYTSETQKTIKKFIKKFYKWFLGNNLTYPDLVSWIDTSGKMPEIQALKSPKQYRRIILL